MPPDPNPDAGPPAVTEPVVGADAPAPTGPGTPPDLAPPRPPAGGPAPDAAGPPVVIKSVEIVVSDTPGPAAHKTPPGPVPPPPPAADPGPAKEAGVGKYLPGREIGTGGFCRVFESRDVGLDRAVAIKVLRQRYAGNPEARQRLLREGRLTAKVKSDHVVEVYRLSRCTDRTLYLVMPRLEGETLQDRLGWNKKPSPAVALTVAEHLARALTVCHARGVIHRDVKPSNVWLELQPDEPEPSDGFHRAVLFDFGLAKEYLTDRSNLTGTMQPVGTKGYMSPEQAESARQAGAPADVFALGVILYQMTTGVRPFRDNYVDQVIAANVLGEAPPPRARPAAERNPDVPNPLSDLIARMVSPEPGERPTAAEVLEEVRALRGKPAAPGPAPRTLWQDHPPARPGRAAGPRPPAPVWAKPAALGAVGGLLLACFVALVLVLLR